ncbi:uncharacterized protein LOC135388575 [Ornithodoros turicata]|uniref:uncharacterized protein LOC135388575 n=1 Tax=Ornithodoros turicata TaxID=34597 RepID=UPI003138A1C4
MKVFLRASIVLYSLCSTAAMGYKPQLYSHINLNQFCTGAGEANTELYNASSPKSSAIVVATQRRQRLDSQEKCEHEVSTVGGTGLIITIIEMNLRKGAAEGTCIDFLHLVTRFLFTNDNDKKCGVVTRDNFTESTSTYPVCITLYVKTPVSYFVDKNLVKIVLTSYIEPHDGKCDAGLFKCDNNRCIFMEYRCDTVNNCGDNSDEAMFGLSACVMPMRSLILIVFGVTNFTITWCAVLYCCLRSAIATAKKLQEERWGSTMALTTTARGSSAQDVTVEGFVQPDGGDALSTGPIDSTARLRPGAFKA